MSHPFDDIREGPYPDDRERYFCSCCRVTFVEDYPQYYDVTPCPGCNCMALNVKFAVKPEQEKLFRLLKDLE